MARQIPGDASQKLFGALGAESVEEWVRQTVTILAFTPPDPRRENVEFLTYDFIGHLHEPRRA
jgi:hypothetical protein